MLEQATYAAPHLVRRRTQEVAVAARLNLFAATSRRAGPARDYLTSLVFARATNKLACDAR
jgi:hypothetical protein